MEYMEDYKEFQNYTRVLKKVKEYHHVDPLYPIQDQVQNSLQHMLTFTQKTLLRN